MAFALSNLPNPLDPLSPTEWLQQFGHERGNIALEIQQGMLKDARQLINIGDNLNEMANGMTALHSILHEPSLVKKQASLDVWVNHLLRKGADANVVDAFGRTALEIAIEGYKQDSDTFKDVLIPLYLASSQATPEQELAVLELSLSHPDALKDVLNKVSAETVGNFERQASVPLLGPNLVPGEHYKLEIIKLAVAKGADVNAAIRYWMTAPYSEDETSVNMALLFEHVKPNFMDEVSRSEVEVFEKASPFPLLAYVIVKAKDTNLHRAVSKGVDLNKAFKYFIAASWDESVYMMKKLDLSLLETLDGDTIVAWERAFRKSTLGYALKYSTVPDGNYYKYSPPADVKALIERVISKGADVNAAIEYWMKPVSTSGPNWQQESNLRWVNLRFLADHMDAAFMEQIDRNAVVAFDKDPVVANLGNTRVPLLGYALYADRSRDEKKLIIQLALAKGADIKKATNYWAAVTSNHRSESSLDNYVLVFHAE